MSGANNFPLTNSRDGPIPGTAQFQDGREQRFRLAPGLA